MRFNAAGSRVARSAAILISLVLAAFIPGHVRAQTGSYSYLSVTGTLDVSGSTTLYGEWTGDNAVPGAVFSYSDGSSGTNALFLDTLTRPGAAWYWSRLNTSGTALNVMELSGSNQLILSGTGASGSILLDPNAGQITINGEQVLTEADGIFGSSSGEVGIGTSSPESLLTISGGPVDISPGGGGNYNEGIRIHPASNGYSDIQLGAVTGSAGTGAGQWSLVAAPGSGNNDFGIFAGASGSPALNVTPGGNVSLGGTSAHGLLNIYSNANDPSTVFTWLQNVNTGSSVQAGLNMFVGSSWQANGSLGGSLVITSATTQWFGGTPALYLSTVQDNNGYTPALGINQSANARIFIPASSASDYGFVGINTTTPQAQLDVNGGAYVRGSLIVAGTMVSGTVVATGTNLALVPQQGDLSMGPFTAGALPQ